MFSTFTTIATLVAVPVLVWAIWFVVEFLRYVFSGEYEMDKRLQNFKR